MVRLDRLKQSPPGCQAADKLILLGKFIAYALPEHVLVQVTYVAHIKDSARGRPQELTSCPATSSRESSLHRVQIPVDESGAFYEIHVWAWEENPQGSYADWNTQVTCTHQAL